MDKSWDLIAKRWRENLVNKLQERYGLAEEQARKKADAWLQWLRRQQDLQPQNSGVAETRGVRRPLRLGLRIRSSKSRSAAATRL